MILSIIKKKNFIALPLTDLIQMIGTLLSISIFSTIDINFFSLYVLVLTLVEMTNSISLFGNEKFFQKNLSQSGNISRKFINESFSLNFLLSIIFFIFFSIFNLLFYNDKNLTLSLILFAPVLLNFRVFLTLIFRYNKKNIPVLKAKFITVFIGLILKYLFLFYNIDVFYICLIIFLEQVFEILLLVSFSKKEKKYFPNQLIFDLKNLYSLLRLLFPIGFSIILFTFLLRVEILFINQLLSPLLASGFFICVKIFNSMLIFPRSVISYEFPKLIKSKSHELLKNVYTFYKLILLSAIVGSFAMYVLGYIYISIFIENELFFAIEFLKYFSLAFFLQCIAGIRNSFLILVNSHDDILLPQVLSFIFKILFSIILIKNFGAIGACLSFVLIELLNISIFNLFSKNTRKLLKIFTFQLKKL